MINCFKKFSFVFIHGKTTFILTRLYNLKHRALTGEIYRNGDQVLALL